MPVVLELLYLSVDLAGSLVLVKDNSSLSAVALTHNVDEFLCLAGSKSYIALKSSAGVGVVVHNAVALAGFYSDRIRESSVWSDEVAERAVIACYRLTNHAEEALLMIRASLVETGILVHMLDNAVLLEACTRNEERILEVDLVLLIVGLVCELDHTVNGELSLLVGSVSHLCAPNLVCLAIGNVVCHLRLYACVLSRDDRICSTVAALALVLVKGLAYGLP